MNILGGIVFFLAYIGVSYFIDKKIDFPVAIISSIIYVIFLFIFKKKKK